MTHLDAVDLARRGNPEAIAQLLEQAIASDRIGVSVDREDGKLSIGLYGDTAPSLELIRIVVQTLRSLELEFIHLARIFGYRAGQFVPEWSRLVDLDAVDPLPDPTAPAVAGDGDRFIVCGMSSLGQYCIANLWRFATNEFGIRITAIDRAAPDTWEIDNLPDLLDQPLIVGDCSQDAVLRQAGIEDCRAILIVTNQENLNIETAIAARQLNPTARIVVRSSRMNLNQLLKQQLGNFVALEPTVLPAPTFALAGLGEGTLGLFNVGDRRLRVVQQTIQPQDYRFEGLSAHQTHRRTHRLLQFCAADLSQQPPADVPLSASTAFYQWHPDTRLQAGDTIAFIEVMDAPVGTKPVAPPRTVRQAIAQVWLSLGNLRGKGAQLHDWIQQHHTRQIMVWALVVATILWIIGTILLKASLPQMSWQKAISSGIILLLGGYGDVFGGLENDPVPWWVQLICLLITAVSLLFILGVLGLIADNLLSSRFEFLRRRSPIPSSDHIVVVGLGRVGQQIVSLLHNVQAPLVVVTETLDWVSHWPHLPMLVGNPITHLARVNLATARSLVVVTEDQMLNLEAALLARNAARSLNRDLGLVIRTYDQRFSANLMKLLPDAKALCADELSAEAFAGAAFGETMLSLFQLNQQTILVAEYCVAAGDTLDHKLLAEVAYGYGVVPIYYRKAGASSTDGTEAFMPSDDLRLHPGDRLIILASINGLRRIERGEQMPPRRWRLTADQPLNPASLHDMGTDLARISGCRLEEARAFMEQLPGAMELPLYDHQAYRLYRELNKQLPITLAAL